MRKRHFETHRDGERQIETHRDRDTLKHIERQEEIGRDR